MTTARRRGPAAARKTRAAAAPLENEFQSAVFDIARRYGWKVVHHPDSRRVTKRGWPDLTLIKRPRMVFAELKKHDGVLSADQREMLQEIAACGAEVALWRPADLALIVRVLGPRGERATLPEVLR